MIASFYLTAEQRKQTIEDAMRMAQEHARLHGLRPDAKIVHPDLEYAYRLVSVDDRGMATLEIPASCSSTGQQLTACKPFDELYDANVCYTFAMSLGSRELQEGLAATFGVDDFAEL